MRTSPSPGIDRPGTDLRPADVLQHPLDRTVHVHRAHAPGVRIVGQAVLIERQPEPARWAEAERSGVVDVVLVVVDVVLVVVVGLSFTYCTE